MLAFSIAAVFVLVVVIVSVLVRNDDSDDLGPLPLATVPEEAADSPACRDLLAAMPPTLDADGDELERRELAQPAPPGAVAWGEPAIVLRCGLGRPAELNPTSRLLDVSGVDFLEIGDEIATTWVAVDRPVYVAITLPRGTGSGPLQQLAAELQGVLPVGPVDLDG